VLILFFHLKPAVAVGPRSASRLRFKFAVLPLYLKRKQVTTGSWGCSAWAAFQVSWWACTLLSQLDTKSHEGRHLSAAREHDFHRLYGSLYRTIRNRLTAAHADHARWLPPIAAIIGGEVGFSSAGAGALGALVLLNLTTLTAPRWSARTWCSLHRVSTIGGEPASSLRVNTDKLIMIKLVVGGVAAR